VFDPAHAEWPSPIMNRLMIECVAFIVVER
jgi:hypothetical protein